MQRYSFWLLILATLYVSACTTATRTPAPVFESPVSTPEIAPDAASASTASEPIITALTPSILDFTPLPAGVPPLPAAEHYAPHIALILPLKSPAFASAASAVKDGFLAAAELNKQISTIAIRIYNSVEENTDVIDVYRQAIANGAVAVVGPITRSSVSQLAAYPYIPVPTLALNITEQPSDAFKLYFFGLPPESEARHIAQLAFKNKLRDATLINSGTNLSKRLTLAFAEEWQKLGGNINGEVIYREGDDVNRLINLPTSPWLVEPPPPEPIIVISPTGEETIMPPKRTGPPPAAPGNFVFLASDVKQARLIRPYINPSLPVYSTSQIFNKDSDTLTNYDLNEIRFIDMPWLLQPEHAAVMIYPRSVTKLDTDKERLYAFGIDSYRLITVMLTNSLNKALPLDGVTGHISLVNNTFKRNALAASFKYGRGLTPETLAALEAEKAAAKAAEIAAARAAAGETTATTPTPAK